jgi:hypothetical protein
VQISWAPEQVFVYHGPCYLENAHCYAVFVMHYVCCITYTLSIAGVVFKSVTVVPTIYIHRYVKSFLQTRGCEPILQNPCQRL